MSYSSQPLQHRTRMFARVIGPYLIAVAAAAALRPTEMKSMLALFEDNPLWSWVTGAFILLLGLVTIALHSYWHGVAAVVVSVVGWMVAVKGLMLVTFPHSYFGVADSAIDAVAWWQTGAAVYVFVGIYLTYVGWIPQRVRPSSQVAVSTSDIRRAA
ncbi:hypothetical protein [Mycobacterium sp.]|uniref:hypothetical protein n=1 Tax=Mycobacterium sp. TaxID=1785 RepID=UPI0025E0788B|nr:hypothetical protein [Mycobacterium sp.]